MDELKQAKTIDMLKQIVESLYKGALGLEQVREEALKTQNFQALDQACFAFFNVFKEIMKVIREMEE